MNERRSRRGSARAIPLAYGGITAALVVMIAAVAFVVRPPSSPAIAEFQPSAQDRINEARRDQAAGSGGTTGGCASGTTNCAEGGASHRPPVEVAAGRRCYGKPLRQTEDPQSPPCVFQIFKGANGGATAKGVSASEVKIVVVVPSFSDKVQIETVEALIEHFNRRYEFYGRRLRPVYVAAWPFDDPGANNAAAENILAQQPFGVVSTTLYWSSNAMVHRKLADAKAISVVSGGAPGFNMRDVADGYTWLVDPPLDARLRAGSSFVCNTLKGGIARHAGPEFSGSKRKFAVVTLKEASGGPNPAPLVSGLHACGIDADEFDVPYWYAQSQLSSLMANLRVDGYTTVIPVTPYVQTDLFQVATRSSYLPEWVDLGMAGMHLEYVWAGGGRAMTAGQSEHVIGFTPEARVERPGESPASWAFSEGGGRNAINVEHWYNALLVMASGIQGAGPRLTPASFAAALRSTTFPNPDPGRPPSWQQRIGFGPGDPVFHDDYALWWWSEQAQSQTTDSTSGRGSFCYVGRGARYRPDAFPADADRRLRNPAEPCR
jgi:hypothetical protein